jgi:hypothetical protein
MDHNRSKAIRRGPFPGSFIPLKLREIFYQLGLAPTTRDNRVPWDQVPYALYERGVYVTGLPTRLFFASDRPSGEELRARREQYLKWPPPGVPNPLPILEKACSEPGRVISLPRPPGKHECNFRFGTRY